MKIEMALDIDSLYYFQLFKPRDSLVFWHLYGSLDPNDLTLIYMQMCWHEIRL